VQLIFRVLFPLFDLRYFRGAKGDY
jgi:hypothetical protein